MTKNCTKCDTETIHELKKVECRFHDYIMRVRVEVCCICGDYEKPNWKKLDRMVRLKEAGNKPICDS